MKKLIPMLILSLFVATVSAQSQKHVMCITLSDGKVVKYEVDNVEKMWFDVVSALEFPKADNSKTLNVGDPAASVRQLLNKAGIACTDTMGRIKIADDEYLEIKNFTDKLVTGLTKQKDIHDKCFAWIRENIKYNQADNDPYPVFVNKEAVCQGYANLLFVMLHSQGVPVMVVNGMLDPVGGHAWNYVNCDGIWYVSDPTNGNVYLISNMDGYTGGYYKLLPWSMDVALFKESGCWFDFLDRRLNVCKVVTEESALVVPYSVGGFKVTSFNPTSELPSNVRELYLGKNIDYLGEGNSMGLLLQKSNLEYVYVDPENTEFRSYAGVVYYSYATVPVYIPSAMKHLELMPMETVEKNTVYYHNEVEEIVFAEGTKTIEAWAVEECPNLKVAYIPESTTVADNAFMYVHPDFKIVRTK